LGQGLQTAFERLEKQAFFERFLRTFPFPGRLRKMAVALEVGFEVSCARFARFQLGRVLARRLPEAVDDLCLRIPTSQVLTEDCPANRSAPCIAARSVS